LNRHSSGKRVRLIAIVLVVVLFLIGFVPRYRHSHSLAKETQERASAPPPVEVAQPKMAAADSILLPGTLQAISIAAVQARATGYVRRLYVDIGAKVKAGQVLAEIESPDAEQQVVQAGADTARSQATVGQSVAQLARNVSAVKSAEADYATAQAKVAQALAATTQAQARAASARRTVAQRRADLTQARANYQLAYTTVKRYETLLRQGFVAQQEYDQSAADYKSRAAAVLAAEATVFAAQADVKAADEEVLAQRALVRAARSDAESARSRIAAAEADVSAGRQLVSANQAAVASSQANERRYAILQSFTKVVAPFDGVVTARNVDLGALVTPGATTNLASGGSATGASPSANGGGSAAATPGAAVTAPTVGLFGIAKVDTLRMFVNVPQTEFGSIPAGTAASVTLREYPGAEFRGTVLQRSGAVDATSRTLLTEIRLDNHDGRLLPGMYAQAAFTPAAGQQVLRLPANVVMYGTEGTRVAVVGRDDVVRMRPVTLGRDFGTEIEVLQGVQPGERLVSNPTDDLQDGQKVRVLKPKKKKAASGSGGGGSDTGGADGGGSDRGGSEANAGSGTSGGSGGGSAGSGAGGGGA